MIIKNKIDEKINKKAISELVSYVLLIVLAIAMAAGAYVFLKPYAEKPLPEQECPEAVNIVLENYSCNNGQITFTLKNKGLFNIYGVKLKVINNTEGLQYDFWLYLPDCNQIQKCTNCNEIHEDCLKVNGDLSGNLYYYENFNKIDELVIYPIKAIDNNFRVCANAVVKVPLKNCN